MIFNSRHIEPLHPTLKTFGHVLCFVPYIRRIAHSRTVIRNCDSSMCAFSRVIVMIVWDTCLFFVIKRFVAMFVPLLYLCSLFGAV